MKSKIDFKRMTVVTVIIATIMAGFRSFVVACYMEKNVFENDTYYLSDSAFVLAFSVLTAVAVSAFALVAVVISREKGELVLERGAAPVGSLIAAFSLLGTVFVYIATALDAGQKFGIKSIFIISLMVLTAVKFLVLGLRGDEPIRCGVADALAAIIPVLYSAGSLTEAFMSTNASPLASSGGYRIMALAAVMLFFFYEGKGCIRKCSGAMFFLFGALSVLLLLVYSVPNIILHCFGTFTFDTNAAFSIVDIGFAVYIIARMSSARISKA